MTAREREPPKPAHHPHPDRRAPANHRRFPHALPPAPRRRLPRLRAPRARVRDATHREVRDDKRKIENGPRSAIALIDPRSGLIRVSSSMQCHRPRRRTRHHPQAHPRGQGPRSARAHDAPRRQVAPRRGGTPRQGRHRDDAPRLGGRPQRARCPGHHAPEARLPERQHRDPQVPAPVGRRPALRHLAGGVPEAGPITATATTATTTTRIHTIGGAPAPPSFFGSSAVLVGNPFVDAHRVRHARQDPWKRAAHRAGTPSDTSPSRKRAYRPLPAGRVPAPRRPRPVGAGFQPARRGWKPRLRRQGIGAESPVHGRR